MPKIVAAPPPAEPPAPYPGRAITTLAELDEMLGQAHAAAAVSDDALRRHLESFWMKLPIGLGLDPHSPEYRAEQMATYRHVAGRDYALANEAHPFDLPSLIARPFPFNTKSAAVVGEQLIAIGYIIKAMNLPAEASILEMGVGWGNTALNFALTGYNVTAIDIEHRFIELVGHRADRLGVDVELIEGDFFTIERLDRKFDAILFYEAFHHCDDHLRLLDAIPARLNHGGMLVLAGETIHEPLPYPWGINPGGMAVFSIRHFGWLELCFRESYLLATLEKKGWQTVKHACPLTAAGITYVAHRAA